VPMPDLRLPSPLEKLNDDRLARAWIQVYLKRDDLISPEMPGNKWRKLKYNLAAAAGLGHHRLLTFGGAYSNHVRATGAAGHHFGFSTVGIIRGEEHLPLNPSLADAARYGMHLAYLDRAAYRQKTSAAVTDALRAEYGRFYLLPEGGSNEHAVRGCAEITAELKQPFDVICCPVGTGGTLAGLASGVARGQRAVGFPVLKGGEFLEREVSHLLKAADAEPGPWSLQYGFHFGGFARRKPELDQFIADFRDRHGLTLNWVYTAKMMYGIYALAERAAFPKGTTVIAVITG
jgi:1-aminocyclopropane-1-carboxylate deaminase